MNIIPAIDLLDGACVRLYRGNYDSSIEYCRDPVETAENFQDAGARRLHLVDLDAARGKGANNRKMIRHIREAVDLKIEVGGGLRKEEDIEELFALGIDLFVVGTVLIRDPETVRRWAERYPGRIIAGIDARDGLVRLSGWEEGSEMRDSEAARLAADSGAAEIIYTNIEKDGTLEGPDIERSIVIAAESGLPVIVSGGVRGEEDFAEAARHESEGLKGMIAGKALYEGRIELARLVQKYGEEEMRS